MIIVILANILFWSLLYRWMREAEALRRELRAWERLSAAAFDAWLLDDDDQRFWRCTCNDEHQTSAACPVHGAGPSTTTATETER